MLKQLTLWFFIFSNFAFAQVRASEDMEKEKADIKQLIYNYGKAMSEHDVETMKSYWDEDGDLITVFGQIGTGMEAVERILTEDVTTKLKEAKYIQSIEFVRLITQNVATADVDSAVTGVLDEDGRIMAPFHTHEFYVLINKGGTWRISALRSYIPGPPTKLLLGP